MDDFWLVTTKKPLRKGKIVVNAINAMLSFLVSYVIDLCSIQWSRFLLSVPVYGLMFKNSQRVAMRFF